MHYNIFVSQIVFASEEAIKNENPILFYANTFSQAHKLALDYINKVLETCSYYEYNICAITIYTFTPNGQSKCLRKLQADRIWGYYDDYNNKQVTHEKPNLNWQDIDLNSPEIITFFSYL